MTHLHPGLRSMVAWRAAVLVTCLIGIGHAGATVPDSVLVVAQAAPGLSPTENNPILRYIFSGTGPLVPLPSIPTDTLGDARTLVFSPSGELFVGNRQGSLHGVGGISRFTFDASGNFSPNGWISANGLEDVEDLTFCPSGELFAVNAAIPAIQRFIFDSQGTEIAHGTIPVPQNGKLTCSPGGEIFFVPANTLDVLRFLIDPQTGAATPNGSFAMPGPIQYNQLAFDAEGELFLTQPQGNAVYRVLFDNAGIPVINGFIPVGGGPAGVTFSAANELFVASHFVGGISRFLFDSNGTAIPNGPALATANLGGLAALLLRAPTVGGRAAAMARMLEGAPYLWGGKGKQCSSARFVEPGEIQGGYSYYQCSPTCGERVCDAAVCAVGSGVDCSGLVLWSYNKASNNGGILSQEGADGQYQYNTEDTAEPLMPGDLLFFGTASYKTHVAMYVGPIFGGLDVIESPDCGLAVRFNGKEDMRKRGDFQGYRRVTRAREDLTVVAHSPVTLAVTDPEGLTIDAGSYFFTEREVLREVPGELYYFSKDVDADSDPEEVVVAPVLKEGAYLIHVVPRSGADPADTYDLEAHVLGITTALAQDVTLHDTPEEGYGLLSDGLQVTTFVPLKIDIKPGEWPNSINLRSRGVVPVAVLSTASFDATTIVPLSARFGPGNATEVHGRGHAQEINGDGRPDLLLHFAVDQTGLAAQDTQAILEANTFAGQLVRGTDSVRVIHSSHRR